MNVNDIFYRRDIIIESLDLGYEPMGIIDPNMSNRIMESLDLDYLPLTEGIGSKISNAFKKIKDAVIKFFKNLINKIKDFYKKIRKIDNEPAPTKNGKSAPTKKGKPAPTKKGKPAPAPALTGNSNLALPGPKNIKTRTPGYIRGWLDREYIVQRGENSDIKFENPVKNPQPYDNTGVFFDKVVSLVDDVMEDLNVKKVTDANVYKQEAFKYLEINSADELKNKILDELYINKPVYEMKNIDFETYFDYIEKSEETIKTLSLVRNTFVEVLETFEKEAKKVVMKEYNVDSNTFYSEGNVGLVQGSKYLVQIGLRTINLYMTEFSKLVSNGVRLARMVR